LTVTWDDIVARYRPGDSLRPLVGVSKLAVDHVDGDQICIRQRLWWARLTRADLQTANDILASTDADITPVQFAELLRAHYTSGTDVTTECTRVPNLAAVVLYNMGALGELP
jgi:hypothetical protein